MAAFPDAPRPWIDLSTGINPRPWCGPRATTAALGRLPDPSETAALEAAAAASFGVADTAQVAATPGAEAALRLLPRMTGARSVTIVGPTYGGHAEAWRAAGCAVREVEAGAEVPQSQALVVVNPNNPDGRAWTREALQGLARRTDWLIVDESFVEVAPGLSLAAEAAARLVVLRSFGKFYGLAGVRLGFVVAAPEVIDKVRQAFGDWPVSAEALAAGTAAYADHPWAGETRSRLQRDAARLDGLLAQAGMGAEGGTSLFRLVSTPQAGAWFRRLAEHGLLVRPFEDRPDRLRFGLPGDEDGWRRLQAALDWRPGADAPVAGDAKTAQTPI